MSAEPSPLVSIVLPTYKRAHLLAQAMRSVLDQTHANLELIVVDDNSPDDTAAVVQSFDDPRIRYVKNDPNLKLPRALNRGFSMARGEYLTWTSDDNLLEPTAIEKMVAVLAANDCDFVYADYWLFSEQDADGRPLAPQQIRQPSTLQLDKGNHIGACFMYTRKLYEAVGDYDPELFLVEDYDYFLRAARQFRFCHLAEPLYYFRRDDATLYCSRFPRSRHPTCWCASRMARSTPTPPPRLLPTCCCSTLPNSRMRDCAARWRFASASPIGSVPGWSNVAAPG
jgi:glycosyltransferase involved in cell wall biosynthesis